MAQAVFYALFRLVEIEELSGSEKALQWARDVLDDPVMRQAFGDGVINAVTERAEDDAGRPGD